MNKKLLVGSTVILTATAVSVSVAAGFFRYFSDFAVARKQPGLPHKIKKNVDQKDFVATSSPKDIERVKQLPQEQVSIVSADGLKLRGTIFRPENPKRAIVFMHGWRSSWKRDFALLVEPLLEMDCLLLFAEERAHGESEGQYITYGTKEKEDCVRWAQYLSQENPELPLYLWGISMGATTVMLASASDDLPENLNGIIADCGFTNTAVQMEHLIHQNVPFGTEPILKIYGEHFRRRCDFDISKESTTEALAKNKRPILFFHGNADHFVPTEMSKENYTAAKAEKELVLIDGAAHCKCFRIAPETCFRKVSAFFARCEKKD